VFGWRAEEQSVDLVFGSAWHAAMAHLLKHGYSAENLVESFQVFLKVYRVAFPNAAEDEDLRKPKTPDNAWRGLMEYVVRYSDDDFKVLHTEVAGRVPICDSPLRLLYFKIDNVIEEASGQVSVIERKTAGVGKVITRTWMDQWALSMQIGTYSHVLHMLYDSDKVGGVYIDGFSPANAPKLKKDGEPVANARDIEFNRFLIKMSPQRMDAWLFTANVWYEFLEQDFEDLDCAVTGDPVLQAFPMNPVSCSKYWGCPFRDYCVIWQNPLVHCNEPPLGYKVEFWDPRELETEAEEVIHLDTDKALV
jgi:hypothetical protein